MAKLARYRDLSLTFRAHPVTGDVVKLFDEDAIKASLMNLIMTMNYETPFHPEIGCAVMASLFENISPITAITIRKSIEDVIRNFEPRVDLIEVDVLVDADADGYRARIIYRIANLPDPVVVDFFLERRR
jgi:phage baseplate assembly protein W